MLMASRGFSTLPLFARQLIRKTRRLGPAPARAKSYSMMIFLPGKITTASLILAVHFAHLKCIYIFLMLFGSLFHSNLFWHGRVGWVGEVEKAYWMRVWVGPLRFLSVLHLWLYAWERWWWRWRRRRRRRRLLCRRFLVRHFFRLHLWQRLYVEWERNGFLFCIYLAYILCVGIKFFRSKCGSFLQWCVRTRWMCGAAIASAFWSSHANAMKIYMETIMIMYYGAAAPDASTAFTNFVTMATTPKTKTRSDRKAVRVHSLFSRCYKSRPI